jgi:hypothetical protein
MVFSWSKKGRRERLLAEPFPPAWRAAIESDVEFYRTLTGEERAKLEQDVRILLAEKTWEATRGLLLTDTMKAEIAAQACLLVLHRSVDDYARLTTILVQPQQYKSSDPYVDRAGVMTEEPLTLLGQSWPQGTVVLSWSDAQAGGRDMRDGRNVVLHEFAHQLDTADHTVDGTPLLDGEQGYRRWVEVMTAEFNALRDSAEKGIPTVLDPYGATDEAEFFAVATEVFFERPAPLRARHPALYGVLKDYYRQDPAGRIRLSTFNRPQ